MTRNRCHVRKWPATTLDPSGNADYRVPRPWQGVNGRLDDLLYKLVGRYIDLCASGQARLETVRQLIAHLPSRLIPEKASALIERDLLWACTNGQTC